MKPPKITFGDMWRRFAEAPEHTTPVSAEYHKLRSCMTKIGYPTMMHAEKAVREVSAKKGVPFKAYPCRMCNLFHIAHDKVVK